MTELETLSHFVLTRASNEELNAILGYVKMRRQQITKANVRSVTRGSNVTFTNRQGTLYSGKVVDVKIKNLVVETQHGRYRVPASMITVAQDA